MNVEEEMSRLTIKVGQVDSDGNVVKPRSEPFRVPLGVDGDLDGWDGRKKSVFFSSCERKGKGRKGD